MPRVPVYQPNQVQQKELPNVSYALPLGPEAYGSGIAEGLAYSGRVASVIAKKEIDEANEVAVMSADTKLGEWMNTALFDPQTGAFNRAGKDAFDLPNQVMPEFDKAADQIAAELTRPEQQLAFQRIRQVRRVSINQKLNEHEATQRNAYYNAEAESAIKNSIQSAGNFYNDPRMIEGELTRQAMVFNSLAKRNGWSDELTAQKLLEYQSMTHVEVLNRMIAMKNLGAARAYFKKVQTQMLGDDATKIIQALQTSQTESRAIIRSQLQDIVTAAKYGIPIKGIPSREALQSVFGPEEGAQIHQEVTAYAGLSDTIGQLHSMSAEQILAATRSYVPTQVQGAHLQDQLSRVVESSAREIITHREKDPGGYLISSDPVVAQSWQRVFSAQDGPANFLSLVQERKSELQISNPALLPDTYADQIINQVTNPKENETLYGLIAGEARRWGKNWPTVLKQISPKLPDTVAVIASGISPKAGVALSSVANLKPEELHALIPRGQTSKSVAESVAAEFNEFLKTFPADVGGTRTRNAIFDSAYRLTLRYTNQGQSLSNAIKNAKQDLVGDMYQVESFRGIPYRVPKEVDSRLVARGANNLLGKLRLGLSSSYLDTVGSTLTDEEVASLADPWVRENGYWVTSPDGTGLQLYLDGAPVTNPNGIVSFSWEQLTQQPAVQPRRRTGREAELPLR